MYSIDFKNPLHVHFLGIGGISMSGIAELLSSKGFYVSGSDDTPSKITAHLESLGIQIYYGLKAENIKDDVQLVVYTGAIKSDNSEYMEAARRSLPIMTRAELLGQIIHNYSESVGISGTHGKTTTTSMISEILLTRDADPTINVGGVYPRINGNMRIGSSPYFVFEACEYTNSFLSFYPKVGVILNVFADHLDFFKDLDDIRHSFRLYAENIAPDGCLIINSAIKNLEYFTEGLNRKVITFGLDEKSDFHAANIGYDAFGFGHFDLIAYGKNAGHITLKQPGEYNIANALAAAAATYYLGTSFETIRQGLSSYGGTDRRFQIKGVADGVTVIDDYAHHPDEIRAALTAAQKYPHRKIWCVFQPHTYTRTKELLPDFAKALSLADEVVLAKIYPARETDTLGISSDNIRLKMEEFGKKATYIPTFEEILKFLKKNCCPGDVLITMGAGDVVIIGENYLK